MKKNLCCLLVVVAMVFSVSFVFAEEGSFSLSGDVAYFSKYVGGLGGVTLYDGDVIQGQINLNHSSGLYGILWTSYSPDGGYNDDFGDEIDYILGINKDLGAVNADFSVAFYNCYDLKYHNTGDIYAVSSTLTFSLNEAVSLIAAAEYDAIKGDLDDDGLFYKTGVNISPVENLSLGVCAGGHNGAFGAEKQLISFGRISASYDVSLSHGLTLTPQINFQKSFGKSEEDGGITEDITWAGATLSF